LTTGRLAAAHGRFRFSSIRQVAATVCTNARFLGPTRVQIPNVISISSAVFAQLMAECPFAINGPHSMGMKKTAAHT